MQKCTDYDIQYLVVGSRIITTSQAEGSDINKEGTSVHNQSLVLLLCSKLSNCVASFPGPQNGAGLGMRLVSVYYTRSLISSWLYTACTYAHPALMSLRLASCTTWLAIC